LRRNVHQGNAKNEAVRPALKLSVIIPCWNDARALRETLERFAALPTKPSRELIVADASDDPSVREMASALGAARVIHCPQPSRGRQMNLGAACATGDVLLFQHVDTEFTVEHLQSLAAIMDDERLIGGAFHRRFDERHPRLRWLEKWARLWARIGGGFYGDQSIFVRREHFQRLGGFADIPLMEDMDFARRLRRSGRVALLDPPIGTSARRHQRQGAWRTSVQNGAFILLWHCGVSPWRLHGWYYGARQRKTVAPAE
jgi:rSAM/selenodomain-associated transferase 2